MCVLCPQARAWEREREHRLRPVTCSIAFIPDGDRDFPSPIFFFFFEISCFSKNYTLEINAFIIRQRLETLITAGGHYNNNSNAHDWTRVWIDDCVFRNLTRAFKSVQFENAVKLGNSHTMSRQGGAIIPLSAQKKSRLIWTLLSPHRIYRNRCVRGLKEQQQPFTRKRVESSRRGLLRIKAIGSRDVCANAWPRVGNISPSRVHQRAYIVYIARRHIESRVTCRFPGRKSCTDSTRPTQGHVEFLKKTNRAPCDILMQPRVSPLYYIHTLEPLTSSSRLIYSSHTTHIYAFYYICVYTL